MHKLEQLQKAKKRAHTKLRNLEKVVKQVVAQVQAQTAPVLAAVQLVELPAQILPAAEAVQQVQTVLNTKI